MRTAKRVGNGTVDRRARGPSSLGYTPLHTIPSLFHSVRPRSTPISTINTFMCYNIIDGERVRYPQAIRAVVFFHEKWKQVWNNYSLSCWRQIWYERKAEDMFYCPLFLIMDSPPFWAKTMTSEDFLYSTATKITNKNGLFTNSFISIKFPFLHKSRR